MRSQPYAIPPSYVNAVVIMQTHFSVGQVDNIFSSVSGTAGIGFAHSAWFEVASLLILCKLFVKAEKGCLFMQISTVGFAYRGMQFALMISRNMEALNFSFPYSVSRLSTVPLPLKAVSQVGLLMKLRGARYLPSSQGSQAGDTWLVGIAPVNIECLLRELGPEPHWRAWSPLLPTAKDVGSNLKC